MSTKRDDNDLRLFARSTGFEVSGTGGAGAVSVPVDAIRYLTDQEIGARVRSFFDDCLIYAGADIADRIVAQAGNDRHLLRSEWQKLDGGERRLVTIAKDAGSLEAAAVIDAREEGDADIPYVGN